MIPTTGTKASFRFIRNVIRKHKVSDVTAVTMLMKLPTYAKVPSELLVEMEEMLTLNNNTSPQVTKAIILCFSNLVRKTFINQQDMNHFLLKTYIKFFADRLTSKCYMKLLNYCREFENNINRHCLSRFIWNMKLYK